MKIGNVIIEKSIYDLDIEKGKKAFSGETRKWGNETWRKTASGKWEHVSDSHKMSKNEHLETATKHLVRGHNAQISNDNLALQSHAQNAKTHKEIADNLNSNELTEEFLNSSQEITNKYNALNTAFKAFNSLEVSELSLSQYSSLVDKKIALDKEVGDNNVSNRDLDINIVLNSENDIDITFMQIDNYRITDGRFGGGNNFPTGAYEGGDELEPIYTKTTLTVPNNFADVTDTIENYCENLEYLSDDMDDYYVEKSLSNDIEKGKKATTGEIRTHADGKKYKKQANGKWQQVSESHNLTAEEHRDKSMSNKGKFLKNVDKDKNKAGEYLDESKKHNKIISKLDEKEYDDSHFEDKENKTPQNSPKIGKTKSGKTVYKDGSEHEQDEDWTSEDHEDASKFHEKEMNKTYKHGHDKNSLHHANQSEKHNEKSEDKKQQK